jgi:hypothetical protein
MTHHNSSQLITTHHNSSEFITFHNNSPQPLRKNRIYTTTSTHFQIIFNSTSTQLQFNFNSGKTRINKRRHWLCELLRAKIYTAGRGEKRRTQKNNNEHSQLRLYPAKYLQKFILRTKVYTSPQLFPPRTKINPNLLKCTLSHLTLLCTKKNPNLLKYTKILKSMLLYIW